ncbi:hypothetical protein FRACA_830014 [Frankia canadensis]|uniref:Toxin-antitoxin system HicB family antitoxin n=1 Tax=Frankia canadensis TaxID=1836972 RepID=A0A2I2L1Q9_9ACTN|nr:hypothetical protein FRACA_830014 [Frankia canadensis]SOU59141.1 hypothetical protein FRACA_830014 [Frankia canadensis]
MAERRKILLRLDPAVHDALARWAGDELRSTNAQIEFLLRDALRSAGRMPADAGLLPRRGRPPVGDGGSRRDRFCPARRDRRMTHLVRVSRSLEANPVVWLLGNGLVNRVNLSAPSPL